MVRLPVLLTAALLWLFWPSGTRGDASDAVLADLQRLAAGVTSVQSDFVQEKHLVIFKEVLVSKGRFFYRRPDQLRWELTEPMAAGFVLNSGRGRRWNARTGQPQPFELDREPAMKLIAEQLFAWTTADFNRMRRGYRLTVVQTAPVVLRLEPLSNGGFLDHLQVAFSADRRTLTSVELHERGGDFTRIRFDNTVLNAALNDRLF